jgi:hypothetical protein
MPRNVIGARLIFFSDKQFFLKFWIQVLISHLEREHKSYIDPNLIANRKEEDIHSSQPQLFCVLT